MSSFKNVRDSGIGPRHLDNQFAYYPRQTPPVDPAPWYREPSWLTLPTVLSTDEKFVGLYAVTAGASNLAFTCTNNYTVDWGDGSAPENIASGVKAEHVYDFNNVNLAGTNAPVTFTVSTSTVNRTSHGLSDGMYATFYNLTSTTGIIDGARYYIVNATTNTFQVSNNLGGTPITFTGTDGTADLLHYKQAIVTITPQATGSPIGLSSVNLNVQTTGSSSTAPYVSGWLDIIFSLPNCSASGLTISAATNYVRHGQLEQVIGVNIGSLTDGSYMFSNCVQINSIQLPPGLTTTNHMFYYNSSMYAAPLFDTSTVTDMSYMFYKCWSLVMLPEYDTSSVTNMSNMFLDCNAIKEVRLNTSSVTDFNNMFASCYALPKAPNLDTSSGTNFYSMFDRCGGLIEGANYDFSNATDLSYLYSNCTSLKMTHPVNAPLATTLEGMFWYCESVEQIADINAPNATSTLYMFLNCFSLKKAPNITTQSVTTTNGMFTSCWALEEVPLYDTSSVTDMNGMFLQCFALRSVPPLNTSLVTDFGSMFGACYTLETIPAFDTSAALSMGGIFGGCYKLKSLPYLNTSTVTNGYGMFGDCRSLESVPAYDFSSMTTATYLFTSCYNLKSIPALTFAGGATVSGQLAPNCYSLTSCGIVPTATCQFNNTDMGVTEMNNLLNSLQTVATAQTITITGSRATYGTTSQYASVTSGNTTIPLTNTAKITVGQYVYGGTSLGIMNGYSLTTSTSTNSIVATNHGLSVNDRIGFPYLISTTDFALKTMYYVVNVIDANNFQVSTTLGGAAITVTVNTSGSFRTPATVTAVIPNTSITVSRAPTLTTTLNVITTDVDTNNPIIRGWSVTL